MKKFAIIGSAGYIAERHMKAINETGNDLIACCDNFDVMGKIDSLFPDAEFFINKIKFYEYIEKEKIDYMVICTPNNLHPYLCIEAMTFGADVICEKPLALKTNILEVLKTNEKAENKRIYTIQQLRHHPEIINLKKQISESNKDNYEINLTYITPRGKWYHKSWKADHEKSGGIMMNIGIHFFDMLIWIFGDVENIKSTTVFDNKAFGEFKLTRANVKWYLSIDKNDLTKNRTSFRQILIDGISLEFSAGFTNLHTISYEHILNGNGFIIDDVWKSIELVNNLQNK